tara:strand:+ start:674 stop:1066 length:393 start_codon:yes stop_codon:yes gene_type:complete
MSKGLSPKLPLTKDPVDGYALNKDYVELVKQNLKMILLTAPGERIMEPDFGVGLRNYLFRNDTVSTRNDINTRITNQVNTYMPFVKILEIDFNSLDNQVNSSASELKVNMKFQIIPLNIFASLEIEVGTN